MVERLEKEFDGKQKTAPQSKEIQVEYSKYEAKFTMILKKANWNTNQLLVLQKKMYQHCSTAPPQID